jgi:cytochrome c
VRRVLIGVILLSAAAVALGFVHPFGDPRDVPVKGRATLLEGSNVSADAKAVLINKCADCHSNETRWPRYSRVAPGSWLMERDIVEGRRHMNLSNWEATPADRRETLLAKVIQETKTGKMPPIQYLALHWGARLSKDDLAALAKLGESAGETDVPANGPADAAQGKAVFERRCTGCHAINDNREGPRLGGVYGRQAGSVQDYHYSNGLKSAGGAGLKWTDATLERWLRDPEMMVPDTNMEFHVSKASERRDLIAYLKQQ